MFKFIEESLFIEIFYKYINVINQKIKSEPKF